MIMYFLILQLIYTFYLRGYKAIDKEIQLIKNCKNKKNFIDGLYKLEKTRKEIKQNKTLERIETIFQLTPIFKNNNFYAASLNGVTTKYKYKNKNQNIMFAIVFGFILGTIYVYVSNSLELKRKARKKNN